MSSAPARTLPSRTPASRALPILRRLGRGIAWAVLLALLAISGAGLLGETFHAPGSPARAELTWNGDSSIDVQLDEATRQLELIAADVNELAADAKTALSEVSSTDASRLRAALEHGGSVVTKIDQAAKHLRTALVGLPGDGPTAALDYSNATLVRRAAILAAIDAASSVANEWQSVTGRAVDAAEVVSLISKHDQTVVSALQLGVDAKYKGTLPILDEALGITEQIHDLRVRLITTTDQTVLDEWVDRNAAYDKALQALYKALVKSKGKLTIEVQAARRDERIAFNNLPPDRRTIIVIVSEVARGGLTQAVLAIESAHGQIDAALDGAAG
ncbi:MAG TPA: hypothetical protein VFI15_02690 [Candidatus Limnocylindrales bacterium]|nr:hypothetical protein [Candidatus Limnocylindrales bacterium]